MVTRGGVWISPKSDDVIYEQPLKDTNKMCELQTDDLFIFSIVRINSKTSHPCSSSSSMGTQSFEATFRGREVGTPLADSFP